MSASTAINTLHRSGLGRLVTPTFSDAGVLDRLTPDADTVPRSFGLPGTRMEDSLMGRVGQGLRSAWDHVTAGPHMADKGSLMGALGWGAKALPAVLAGTWLYNRLSDNPTGYTLPAVAGTATGAALGALSGHFRKEGSFFGGALQAIASALAADPSLTSSEMASLLSSVAALPASSQATLASMLGSGFGAAAGAIVAKFLGGGLFGTLGGAALGGFLGNRLSQSSSQNNNFDYYGQAF